MLMQPSQNAARGGDGLSVSLADIDESLNNREVDIMTCIVQNAFDWTFQLKEGITTKKEILCKLKLEQNLTDGNTAEETKNKVVWRFTIAPGEKVTRNLYLLDIAKSVYFKCRIAIRDVPSQ